MIFISLLCLYVSVNQVLSQTLTRDGCFEIRFNTQLVCGQRVGSRSGIGEQDCLDLCLSTPNCRAVNYNGRSGLCEMFSSPGLTTATARGRSRPRNGRGSDSDERGGPPPFRGVPPPPRGGGGGFRWGRGRAKRSQGSSGSGSNGADDDDAVVQHDAVNSAVQHVVMAHPGGGNVRRRGPDPRSGGGYYGGGGGGGSTNCGYRGPSVESCQGVTYYKRENCGPEERPTTTTTQGPIIGPLPDGVVCPAGQEPRYLRLGGVELIGGDDASFQSNSEQACIDACTANALPNGVQAACFSFEFDPASGTCTLSLERLPPNGNGGSRQTNSDKSYYEKICVDSALVVNCPDVFEQAPQTILVGFARAVTDVNNYADCLDACLNSQARFGFTCRSGMFYYEANSENCLLNSEDSETQGELIAEETIDVVVYFETKCIGTRARDAKLQSDAIPETSIIQKDSSEWGPWTYCDKKDGKQRRFKGCKTSNPSTCSKEVQDCAAEQGRSAKPLPLKEENNTKRTIVSGKLSTNCIAPLKPNGEVDCSIGFKYVNGDRQSCTPEGCRGN